MLEVKHISKRYKTGDFIQQALDDVSISFRDCEFVAILGQSGSGKTTLLNVIGGLDRYDSGDLIINGVATDRYKDRDWDSYRNHTIGFVFQSYNLIPHQTVLSNVELALTISGISKPQRRIRARHALKKVGLADHMYKKPNQLSGGQMQRVAIARALVNDPDIVLADEPTGALDSETSVQIMDLLKEVSKDRLVIMVTHNPELAQTYATRIIRLSDGQVTSDSNPVLEKEDTAEVQHRRLGKASMNMATSLVLSFNNLRSKKGRTLLTSFAGSIGIIGIGLILAVSTGVNSYIEAIQRETMSSYPISVEEQSLDFNKLVEDSSADSARTKKGNTRNRKAIYPEDSNIRGTSNLTGSFTQNNLTDFKKYLDNPKSEIHRYIGSVGVQYTYANRFAVFDHDPQGTLVNADGVTVEKTDLSVTNEMASSGFSIGSISQYEDFEIEQLTGKKTENKAPKSFNEIMPGRTGEDLISKVVTDNYSLVKGHWPKSKNQVVLVLDANSEIPLTSVYELGLLPSSEYKDMMNKLNSKQKVETNLAPINYDAIMNQKFTLFPAADLYAKDPSGNYKYVGNNADQVEDLSGSALHLDVVGVIRQHSDSKVTAIPPGIGYTTKLTDYLMDHAKSSPVVKDQMAHRDRNVLNGVTFAPPDDATKAANAQAYVASLGVTQKANIARTIMSAHPNETIQGKNSAQMADMTEQEVADGFDRYMQETSQDILVSIYNQYVSPGTYDDNMTNFGVIDRNTPSTIKIYADSFESKNRISEAIDKYNGSLKNPKDKIVYTDYAGLLMNSVVRIVNVVSYVLIAFVSVSLVVSSIMIGIITYISVLERTKEIGILRAMGASRRNVSNVFNAETGIIGLLSGVLGVGITLLLLLPSNSLMHQFMHTNQVNASLPVAEGFLLIVLSVILTLIGGLIPSRKASRQDPATALRTE